MLLNCDEATVSAICYMTLEHGQGIDLMWRLWERIQLPGFGKITSNRIMGSLAMILCHKTEWKNGKGPDWYDLRWNHYAYGMGNRAGSPIPGLEEEVKNVRIHENSFWIWIEKHAILPKRSLT